MDINYFLKINNAYGTTNKKDTQLYNLKSQITSRFTDTIDCFNVSVDGVMRDILIIRTTDNNIKTIKSKPDENFNVGDYIVIKGESWMVTSVDELNQVYTSGKITQCNHTLLFQSPTGAILSYPCIDSNSTGSEDETKVITLGSTEKTITLPCDENTILLRNGRRFFIDKYMVEPKSYEITAVDTTSKNYGTKGLILLTVKECVGQDTDRIDLGICNYFVPTPEPEPIPVDTTYSTITYLGNPELRIGGSNKTFTCTAYNSLGEVVTITPVWTITALPEFQSYIHQTRTGNINKIKADDITDMSNSIFKLEVQDSEGNFYSAINITLVLGV